MIKAPHSADMKVLKQIWVELASCQTRFMGTDGAAEAVNILKGHLTAFDLQPEISSFRYGGWHPGNPVVLEIDGRSVEAYAMLGSHGRPGAHAPITGQLRHVGAFGIWGTYDWERFALVDSEEEICAYVLGRTQGPAIPQTLPECCDGIPYVSVGSETLSYLLSARASGHAPRGSIQSDSFPLGVREGVSLMADLPDRGEHTLLIGAHYDSFFSTPGAYDNASGAACLAAIASKFRSGIPGTKTRLAWFGAEEWLLAGSKAYVKGQSASGVLPELMINIDGVGRNNTLEAWYGPDALLPELRRTVEPIAAKQGFETTYKFPPPPGSDHAPFYDVGCAVCMLTFNDLEILHRPEDEVDENNLSNMLRMLDLVGGLLGNFDALTQAISEDRRSL